MGLGFDETFVEICKAAKADGERCKEEKEGRDSWRGLSGMQDQHQDRSTH